MICVLSDQTLGDQLAIQAVRVMGTLTKAARWVQSGPLLSAELCCYQRDKRGVRLWRDIDNSGNARSGLETVLVPAPIHFDQSLRDLVHGMFLAASARLTTRQ